MDLAAEARAELARRELARRRLATFCEYLGPTEKGAWIRRQWQDRLCAELEWFFEESFHGRSPRLIVCVPPQEGKSEIVARRGPVWAIAKYGMVGAVATYGKELARHHSREARMYAHGPEANAVFAGLRPERVTGQGYKRNDTDIVDNWTVGTGGRYVARGRGEALTGFPPQFLIVDDPFKDHKECNSPAVREEVWRWFSSVIYTRAARNGSGILVMHTRWNLDDLVGRIDEMERNGHPDKWRRVIIPAQAVAEDDYLGRERGEWLTPANESNYLAAMALNRNDWAALYQQNPIPEGGAIVQSAWFSRRYDEDPARLAMTCDRVVVGADLAFGGTAKSDYCVCVVLGCKGALRYVLDVVRAKLEYTEQKAMVAGVAARWNAKAVVVEEAATGRSVVSELVDDVTGIRGEKPGGANKTLRLRPHLSMMHAGQLILPHAAPWLSVFEAEVLSFPSSAYDDQLDALVWAIRAGEEDIPDDAGIAAALSALSW